MADKANKRTLDFTNVKDRGPYNPVHMPSGDYRAKITAVEETKTKSDKDMWTFAVQLKSRVTAVYPERIVLSENTLWRLRNLLIAAGFSVPKKRVSIDPNKLVGREIGITLEDSEYEGKMKSEITAVFSVDELSSDEPEGVDEDDDSSGESDEEEVSDEDLEEIEVDEL